MISRCFPVFISSVNTWTVRRRIFQQFTERHVLFPITAFFCLLGEAFFLFFLFVSEKSLLCLFKLVQRISAQTVGESRTAVLLCGSRLTLLWLLFGHRVTFFLK